MASAEDSFTFDVDSVLTKTRTQVTYCLRRHKQIGLVWALPSNKSVSALPPPE